DHAGAVLRPLRRRSGDWRRGHRPRGPRLIGRVDPPRGDAGRSVSEGPGTTPERALTTRVLDHCLACGGDDLTPRAMRYEYAGAGFPLVECRRCGMRFLAVQPVGESLAALYTEPYFEADFRCGRSAARSFDESAFV